MCDVIDHQSWFKITVIRRSVSSKITNDTSGKPMCDFLRVNNGNLPPMLHLHCFRDMADYWWNFRCRWVVPLFNASVWNEPLNKFRTAKFGLKKPETPVGVMWL